MRPKFFIPILTVVLLAGSARAQYTDNFQTNTISGVASNWAGTYFVGNNFSGDALVIQTEGALSNDLAYIGYQSGADFNSVLLTDPCSAWSNANDLSVGYLGALNSLTITNGSTVYNSNGYIGNQDGADDNTVLVTGNGSLWNNTNSLAVGQGGNGNSLTVTSVDSVVSPTGIVGILGNNNTALVTCSGSVWSNQIAQSVGVTRSGNSLTIADGGLVVCLFGNTIIEEAGANNNTVLVTGSGLVWNNPTDLSAFLVLRAEKGSKNSFGTVDCQILQTLLIHFAPEFRITKCIGVTLMDSSRVETYSEGKYDETESFFDRTLQGTN